MGTRNTCYLFTLPSEIAISSCLRSLGSNADFTFFSHPYIPHDINWDPADGEFLVSVRSDQKTRLHAPWKQHGRLVSSRFELSLCFSHILIGLLRIIELARSRRSVAKCVVTRPLCIATCNCNQGTPFLDYGNG